MLGTNEEGRPLLFRERAAGCAPKGRHAPLKKGSLVIRCWKQKWVGGDPGVKSRP